MDSITIIGTGKLGSHLYFGLKKAGYEHIHSINRKTNKNLYYKALKYSNIIFICTKDSDISTVAGNLKTILNGEHTRIIFHTSGAISSDILKPLRDKKTFIGSFHPVQTFNNRAKNYNGKLKGIYIAIEGDKKSKLKGISIARKLGSYPFVINKEDKVLHHISSVIASNYLVTLINQISNILNKSPNFSKNKKIFINGFKNVKYFDIYEQLIRTTIDNISAFGATGALTGPIERNDYKTLELHLKNLKRLDSGLLEFYIYMGKETIKLAITKKSLTKTDAKKLTDLFYKYSKK